MSLKSILGVALGILSAIGGFVDIGDLVFNTQAGATFGFQLLWVVVIGVIGIIVYSEMCGRVSAVSERPVFDLVRERAGLRRRARHADRVPDRQPHDVRGGSRRRRDLLPAALRAPVPAAHPARRARARDLLVASAVRVARAPLRLLRPRPARLRGRRDQAPPGLGQGRPRVRPGCARGRQPVGLPLLRGRPAGRGHDAVRGLLLLVGRGRGSAGASRTSSSTA